MFEHLYQETWMTHIFYLLNDSNEDHIFNVLFCFVLAHRETKYLRYKSAVHFYSMLDMISTLIRLAKRWPLYEISTDPPLHEVNSRLHDADVHMEYQSSLFFATLPQSEETFPLVILTWWKIDLCKIHEFITFEGIFHYWSIGQW